MSVALALDIFAVSWKFPALRETGMLSNHMEPANLAEALLTHALP